jgi:NAD-dependent dihydropyrimidine dehydrogenase PreA subunit
MAVLINFKICDNSRDCSGIAVCPTGAFYWDEKRKTIAVDNEKCISCGRCEESCPVGAIRVAGTKKEYERIKKEIRNDPRKVSDLFVDRYGAEPQSHAFQIPLSKFDIQILESTKPAVTELFSRNSVKCLLYSIPVRELFKNIDVKYRKIKVKKNDSLLRKYKVKKLPSLLFFRKGKLIGKIEGYYDIRKKKDLSGRINKILAGKGN